MALRRFQRAADQRFHHYARDVMSTWWMVRQHTDHPPPGARQRVPSVDMATAAKLTDQPVNVRLPRELHEAVLTRASAEDRTMAQTIRVALRYYLQNTDPIAAA